MMSDDDILMLGAIQIVLDEIRRNNYSLIVVNYEVRNNDFSKDEKRLQINENKIYTPLENEKLFIFIDT